MEYVQNLRHSDNIFEVNFNENDPNSERTLIFSSFHQMLVILLFNERNQILTFQEIQNAVRLPPLVLEKVLFPLYELSIKILRKRPLTKKCYPSDKFRLNWKHTKHWKRGWKRAIVPRLKPIPSVVH